MVFDLCMCPSEQPMSNWSQSEEQVSPLLCPHQFCENIDGEKIPEEEMVKRKACVNLTPLLVAETTPWEVWWEWKIGKGQRQLVILCPQPELQSSQPPLGTSASPLDYVSLHFYFPTRSHRGYLPLWVNAERKQ